MEFFPSPRGVRALRGDQGPVHPGGRLGLWASSIYPPERRRIREQLERSERLEQELRELREKIRKLLESSAATRPEPRCSPPRIGPLRSATSRRVASSNGVRSIGIRSRQEASRVTPVAPENVPCRTPRLSASHGSAAPTVARTSTSRSGSDDGPSPSFRSLNLESSRSRSHATTVRAVIGASMPAARSLLMCRTGSPWSLGWYNFACSD